MTDTLLTNQLKKGTRILLSNGWEADLMDNKMGNIRLAKVYGFYTEIGSVYAHDIVKAFVDGKWVTVYPTTKQSQLKWKINSS